MAYSVEFTDDRNELGRGAADVYLAMDGREDALRQARTYIYTGYRIICIKDDAGKIVMNGEEVLKLLGIT